MAQTVSQPRPAAIAAVLAKASTWTAARRKSDGREFWIIQGNRPGAVYYADATACTCPDARERGRVCKHSLAIQKRQQPSVQKRRANYRDVFGVCDVTSCDEDRETGERFCGRHVLTDAF